MRRLFPFDYTFIIATRHSSFLVVHSLNSWMRTMADKSAMCTINRHLHFPGELANAPLSGGFGWKGKYIVVPSSEKVRKEP
jgi:hypothetical protein